MNYKIDISHKTIFFLTAFLALLAALFLIRDVIILLFVAVIFMSALSPIVTRLEKLKIPKALAIAIIYVVIISVVAALVTFVVTPFTEQVATLTTNLPKYLITLIPESGFIDRSVLQQEFGNFSKNALEVSLAIFNNFIAFISIAVLTFYLLLERDNLDKLLAQFFLRKEDRIKRTTKRIEEKLGSWMRGQIALTLIIGVASYIGLSLMGVPYALPLAILAGVLEIIPVIGPIISAIPAVLIAFLISPFTAGMVAYPGRTFGQLYHRFVKGNALVEGTLDLGDRTISVADITAPVLVFAGATDGIAPVPAVRALVPLLTGAADVRFEIVPGGHLGMLTGRRARGTTWRALDEWITQWSSDARSERSDGPPPPSTLPTIGTRKKRRHGSAASRALSK